MSQPICAYETLFEFNHRYGIDVFGLNWAGVLKALGIEIISVVKTAECEVFLLSASTLYLSNSKVVLITCTEVSLREVTRCLNLYEIVVQLVKLEQRGKINRTKFAIIKDQVSETFLVPTQEIQIINSEFSSCLLTKSCEVFSSNFVSFERDYCKTPGAEFLNLLRTFQIADFHFKPHGYSLNAVKGHSLVTLHLSPEFCMTSLDLSLDLVPLRTNLLAALCSV